MNKIVLSQKAKTEDQRKNLFKRKDWVSFVGNQFAELTRKNLQVPIKLYQL